MSSFEDDVLGRISRVEADANLRQQQEAEARAREARMIRERQERVDRSIELSTKAARLLTDRAVRSVPVWVRSGPQMKQESSGWHVATMQEYRGAELPTRSQFIALDARNRLLMFDHAQFGEKGTTYKGIVFPREVPDGQGKLQLLESEAFMNGLASLVAGRGPYEDPTAVSFGH
jgi:hypothetical protein